jgi:hypothetical protein
MAGVVTANLPGSILPAQSKAASTNPEPSDSGNAVEEKSQTRNVIDEILASRTTVESYLGTFQYFPSYGEKILSGPKDGPASFHGAKVYQRFYVQNGEVDAGRIAVFFSIQDDRPVGVQTKAPTGGVYQKRPQTDMDYSAEDLMRMTAENSRTESIRTKHRGTSIEILRRIIGGSTEAQLFFVPATMPCHSFKTERKGTEDLAEVSKELILGRWRITFKRTIGEEHFSQGQNWDAITWTITQSD